MILKQGLHNGKDESNYIKSDTTDVSYTTQWTDASGVSFTTIPLTVDNTGTFTYAIKRIYDVGRYGATTDTSKLLTTSTTLEQPCLLKLQPNTKFSIKM